MLLNLIHPSDFILSAPRHARQASQNLRYPAVGRDRFIVAAYLAGYFALGHARKHIELGMMREYGSRGLCPMYWPMGWIERKITGGRVFLMHERNTVHMFIVPLKQ